MGKPKKVLLCILDGFGICEEKRGNATLDAHFINDLLSKNGTLLKASGESVGLLSGQSGNSEVGHMTIGAGRIFKQKLPLIKDAIESGNLARDAKLCGFLSGLDTCHLMALFSSGGVHSDLSHLFWAIKHLREKNISPKCHLFFDGRDVGFRDGLKTLVTALDQDDLRLSEVATIQGRFFAMDRDNRLERTQTAFDLVVNGTAKHRCDGSKILAHIQKLYDEGTDDEMMPQIAIGDYFGAEPNASFWCLNFRADRIRQILSRLSEAGFSILSMTNFDSSDSSSACVLFEQQEAKNTLGEVLAREGLRQLRIAETEKYAHVTYFFNGGLETQFPHEDRILVPSPGVDNYATTPEMSAHLVASEVLQALKTASHDVIIVNFANADMVGHTGDFEATKQAICVLDDIMRKLVDAALDCGFDVIITSDHGNAECMIDEHFEHCKTHTCSAVPFIYLPCCERLRPGGELQDISPTILKILNIAQPEDMTGTSLI